MKKRISGCVIAGLLFASFFSLLSPRVRASGDEVDLVVGKSSSVSTLSLDDARKIFLCEKSTWPGGKRITVLMFAPGQPARSTVLREIYKMSETDYSKYFLEAVFAGRLPAPPSEAGSAAQMKQYLTANPWAIGYLRREDVDNTVKVVCRIP
jgi:hypothetical protein